MGSLFQLTSAVLPFLTLLNNSVETITLAQNDTWNDTLIDAIQNTTVSATPLKIPTDFSTLLTFIYSFSALRDYLKLIVLGGAFETLRRLYTASYKSLVNRFFITATFESDVSYGEHPFPPPSITELTRGSLFRVDDVLALFSSSVSSVPEFFSQHFRSQEQFSCDW